MSKDLKVKAIIGGIIVAIVFFGIGMAAGRHSGKRGQMNRMGDRSGMMQGGSFQGGMPNGAQGGRMGGMNRGGGFASGEIISSDDKSITIKLQDGGSKVIYLTDTTPVMKSTSVAKSDLATGITVTVNGTSNADGSIAAQSVQIRPAGIAVPMGQATQPKQ